MTIKIVVVMDFAVSVDAHVKMDIMAKHVIKRIVRIHFVMLTLILWRFNIVHIVVKMVFAM